MPALGLHRSVRQRVGGHVEAHADGIRLVGLEGLEHEVDLRVEDHVAVRGVLVHADHLLEELVGDAFLIAKAELVVAGIGAGNELTTRAVEVAGDGCSAMMHWLFAYRRSSGRRRGPT